MCMCVTDIWGSLFSSRAESILMDAEEKDDLKGRQNLSHETGTFLDLLFLLCLCPKLLLRSHLASSVGLGCFPVTISETDQQLDLSPVEEHPHLLHLLFPLHQSVLTVRLPFPQIVS